MVRVPGHRPFRVLCDSEIAGLGWMVIQRRQNGLVNFYRDWSEYKVGFGDLNTDFFIGLEKLNWLTSYQPFELYIYMENFNGQNYFAKYDEVVIGDESELFSLKVLGTYTGGNGDALTSLSGKKFSTFDRDNDGEDNINCAQFNVGAWWYDRCSSRDRNWDYTSESSNLNGQYLDETSPIIEIPTDKNRYIRWSYSGGPLKKVQIMIRPKFACF